MPVEASQWLQSECVWAKEQSLETYSVQLNTFTEDSF